MKEKTMILILMLAIVFLTFYTSFAYANEDVVENISTPVLVEAITENGRSVLIFYYPESDRLCFMNERARVCMDFEGFSTSYRAFVEYKVSESRQQLSKVKEKE